MIDIFMLFVVLAVLFIGWNFQVLWRKDEDLADNVERDPVGLSGNVFFISDLQICKYDNIPRLDVSDADELVIVGDLFHSSEGAESFGDTERDRLMSVLKRLFPGYEGNVYFVRGGTHDPVFLDKRYDLEGMVFHNLGDSAMLSVNGVNKVFLYHGHQLFSGLIGGGASWVVKRLGFPMLFERVLRWRLGVPRDVWMISGHSHIPALLEGKKMANTGSFAGVPFQFFFNVSVGTGIVINKEGEVELVTIDSSKSYQDRERESDVGV